MSSTPLLRKRRSATSSSLSKKNVSRKQDFAYDESSLSDTDCSETKHGSSFYISSAVRHMAWWRISLFLIMWMEWNFDNVLTPFGALDITTNVKAQQSGHDAWFRYEQFAWLQILHVHLSSTPVGPYLKTIGYLCCFVAAFGKNLPLVSNALWKSATFSFLILYCIRFWAKATNFTNHNYLFFCSCSGPYYQEEETYQDGYTIMARQVRLVRKLLAKSPL